MKSIAIVLFCSMAASAACPDGYPSVREEYASSAYVLIGKAVTKRTVPGSGDQYFLDGDTYRVVPTHVYKGNIQGPLELFSENSTGRFTMLLNREYLLFVDEEHGRLMVSNCGKSDLLSHAKKAVAAVARISRK
ncbi:MAG TPA: hypothetical protein VGK36_16075 [Candidatus Angelobacter sp.]|jgi:hypothetical protein